MVAAGAAITLLRSMTGPFIPPGYAPAVPCAHPALESARRGRMRREPETMIPW